MCGIFGYSGVRANGSKLKILALYNESRGGHATGIYSDKMGVVKDIMPADEFIAYYGSDFRAGNMFFGHTRYKTHGANTIENAHPFVVNNVTGIHNGVILNYGEIASQYDTKIEVDSQCIFLAIANNQSTEKDILPDIIGDMAIAYTKNDGLLYLYRRGNPLYVGYSKDKGMYFSSMSDSLYAIECAKVYSLAEHKIYIFNNGKLINTIDVALPVKESSIGWADYRIEDGFCFEDLAALGLSYQTIEKVMLMDYEEQQQYLFKKGYI